MKAKMFFHYSSWKWILIDEDGKTRADFLPDCPWVSWLFGNPKKGVMNIVDLKPSEIVSEEPLPKGV